MDNQSIDTIDRVKDISIPVENSQVTPVHAAPNAPVNRSSTHHNSTMFEACFWLTVMFLAIFVLPPLMTYYFFWRVAVFKFKSIDFGSSIVYEIENKNILRIDITQFHGDILFRKNKLGHFNAEKFAIPNKTRKELKIALSDVAIPSELTEHCMGNEEFQADLYIHAYWPRYFLINSSFDDKLSVRIPCSKITKVGL